MLSDRLLGLNSNIGGETMVIQKFIRPKGPNAFVARVCWRRQKPPYTWMITNKVTFREQEKGPYKNCTENERFATHPSIPLHCSLIKAEGDKNYKEIIEKTEEIAKFIERNTNLKMEELATDFIRDPAGTWWLI